MFYLQRANAKYDDAVSVLDGEKDFMARIEAYLNIADNERRDVARNMYRV